MRVLRGRIFCPGGRIVMSWKGWRSMRRTWVRVLLWVCVTLNAAMIFAFSGQNGETSMSVSDSVVVPVVERVHQARPDTPQKTLESLYWTLQTVVRKGAHFLEYALLGFLVRLLGESYTWRGRGWIAWGGGTLYAVTDEVHQLFSDGRSAQATDVLIDSAGVLSGVLAAMLILSLTRRLMEAEHKRRNKHAEHS